MNRWGRGWMATLFATTLCACAQLNAPASPDAPNGLLAETEWSLAMLGAQGAIATHAPTLVFEQGDRISGSGSCNRFTGTVTVSGKSMSVSPLTSTRMACDPTLSQQESTYFAALQQAQWFLLTGAKLTIYTKALDQPLVFLRTKPPA